MNGKNALLKKQSLKFDIPIKQLAKEMNISETQLYRKINHNKVGASFACLTYCEKFYIAQRLKIDISDIE